MLEPRIPPDEADRLAALQALEILDTPPEERFDRVTRLAADLFEVPIALVSLIDSNRQWFKSCFGLETRQTPRSISFCGHAILSDSALVIPDAKADPRFADNPLVTAEPFIRFYAGKPVSSADGRRMGTLCLIDRKPKQLSSGQLDRLSDLASIVEDELSNITLARTNTLLWRKEEELSHFLEHAHDLIQSVTPEGRFVYVNRAWRQTLGYNPDEAARLNIFDLIDPESRDHCRTMFQELLSGKPVSGIEAVFLTKAGRRVSVSGNAHSLIRTDGKCLTQAIFRDVTEQRKSEEALNRSMGELVKAKQRAEEADRVKSAFLATMSHELRTPLNSIIGFSGVMATKLSGPLNPEQEKQIGLVRSSAEHLLAVINDVLDISKIEAGPLELSMETFPLSDSIQKVVESIRPMAETKSLSLSAEIDDSVGKIRSDRRRLEQILLNIVGNAVKFTPNGEVAVSCRRDHNSYTIQVSDTGIGIRPEDMQKLFMPFLQVDTGLTREHEGTGLGLPIAKGLVERLGGTIGVESQPGRGATFTVSLPA